MRPALLCPLAALLFVLLASPVLAQHTARARDPSTAARVSLEVLTSTGAGLGTLVGTLALAGAITPCDDEDDLAAFGCAGSIVAKWGFLSAGFAPLTLGGTVAVTHRVRGGRGAWWAPVLATAAGSTLFVVSWGTLMHRESALPGIALGVSASLVWLGPVVAAEWSHRRRSARGAENGDRDERPSDDERAEDWFEGGDEATLRQPAWSPVLAAQPGGVYVGLRASL